MPRTGVFLCWCGSNIGAAVDLGAVAGAAADLPHVVRVEDHRFACSELGQAGIRRAIAEHRLDRAVVGACSPRLHEATFAATLAAAGLNPHLLQVANLREQCAWVHRDRAQATAKATDLVRMAAARAARLVPLETARLPVTRRALVIGGGIAGIQAALDIADAGHPVVLVERQPSLGGRMAQLDKTFPTLDCAACILTPKMAEAAAHPLITLMAYSEIEKVDGFAGNFRVTVREKARSVDPGRCTGCGECSRACPARTASSFDLGLGERKAIYIPFPQAVPNCATVDRAACLYYLRRRCQACQRACPAGAIAFDQADRLVELEIGAIVAATGYDQFDPSAYGEYGAGRWPDVITGLHLERMLSASGPTGGEVVRPSDRAKPRTVAFLACVGSRDQAKGKAYCSAACCMYLAKQAISVREKLPDAEVWVFYLDLRAAGKGHEEFCRRAAAGYGARYVRGRVSRIYPKGGRLRVIGEDTLLARRVTVDADLVVLGAAMVPSAGAAELARQLGITYDSDGFLTEAHPKLRPSETNTAGIFLAGCCQGPKDIPGSVAQAGAAASKAIGLLSRPYLMTQAKVAQVTAARCSACMLCAGTCPYGAIAAGAASAEVNPGRCQGCGACVPACRSGALTLLGYTDAQLLSEVEAAWR